MRQSLDPAGDVLVLITIYIAWDQFADGDPPNPFVGEQGLSEKQAEIYIENTNGQSLYVGVPKTPNDPIVTQKDNLPPQFWQHDAERGVVPIQFPWLLSVHDSIGLYHTAYQYSETAVDKNDWTPEWDALFAEAQGAIVYSVDIEVLQYWPT